ncbi:MAG TPA: type VII secretion protein EssC [Anaerovoracaceae bacterium]|nr:type VII secretion protein EssC [Anaerovoracaceae bacterium]
MSLVFAVHFKNSIHEYFLPGLNNRAFRVEIPANVSGYSKDLFLSLEVWNGVWSIVENDVVAFSKSQEGGASLRLEKGLTISCVQKSSHEKFSIVVEDNYEGYSDFDKYILRQGRISIGSGGENSIQYNTQNLVSGKHAVIETDADGLSTITDTSSNGTFVNGIKIHGAQRLNYGDIIYILGLKLVMLGGIIAVNRPSEPVTLKGFVPYKPEPADVASPAEKKEGDDYYQRSPRLIEPLDDETIEIEAPPNPSRSQRQPLIFTIGPSMTMILPMAAGVLFVVWSTQQSENGIASPFMYMGIITSVTAAFIGVFWALANFRYTKRKEHEEEERRSLLYRKYLDKMKSILAQKHTGNKEILDKKYPATQECLNLVKTKNRRLWERNVNHVDFLTVRIGEGEMDSPNDISIPKERFSLIDDSLAEEPQNIKNGFKKLKKAPICISLRDYSLVGVISGRQAACNKIAQVMAAQIASYHSYTDVKMAFVYNEKEAEDFAFARWLPHTWTEDRSLRLIACDSSGVGDLFYHLSGLLRTRLEEKENASAKPHPLPHYVLFITDSALVENEAVMKYLTEPSVEMGISTVLLYNQIGKLPNNCTVIIQNDDDFNGYYSLDSSFKGYDRVRFDNIGRDQLEDFARGLSDIRVRETQSAGAIPQLLTFLDMYRTSRVNDIDVARRWLENRTYESMKAIIGYRGAEAPLYLDIHEKYHGPHGLVAGTTGSGKSETLQTYILSLALNYHPHEVSFILIDYKGGGMAGSFEKLPHVAGIITNLGGNQTNRALSSINSEIKRRQAIFNEYKLKHIDGYIELYRAGKTPMPLPHLIIIADEFAELKKEQPEFVRELVSASRVGRSLGVHLILATQKPSGVVDDEIWGNSKFRLCLRVQDKQDSNEMIKRPDAAYITNAGRGYFQVGNDEIFEAFQSGWSGAKYEPEIKYSDARQGDAKMIDLLGKPRVIGGIKKADIKAGKEKKRTQLETAVAYLSAIAKDQNISPVDNIWLPPLPSRLALQDIEEYTDRCFENDSWRGRPGELSAVIGIVDDPVNQRQIPLSLDILTEGHILIAGSGSSGKSTLMQTLLYSLATTYSPGQLNVYIADFGSRTMGVFGILPHVGGVVFDSETDKAGKLIAMLLKELDRRKTAFSEKGIGSMKEYVRQYHDVPFIVAAIDNFAAFNENCPKQEDNLVLLSREAASYGIYLAITCTNTNDVRNKIRQNIGFGIGLQLADRFEYEDALNAKTDITAEDHTPGRGLACYPKPLEFQTAQSLPDDTGLMTVKLREKFEQMAAVWPGGTAPAIPQVPADMSLDNLTQLPEFSAVMKSPRYMPLGYDIAEAQLVNIDLAATFCCSVSGAPRSGKTNLLKVFMKAAKDKDCQVYIFDSPSRELEAYSGEINADRYMTSADELFHFMQEVFVPEFTARNRAKAEFIKNGRKDTERYIASSQKLFLFIDDMTAFCEAVYGSEREMKGFMEQMVTRGDSHMIYLFAGVSPNDMTGEYGTKRLLRGFTGWKEGVHLGGNIEGQKVFDFEVPVLERSKKLPAGYGHTITGGVTKRIVTPIASE